MAKIRTKDHREKPSKRPVAPMKLEGRIMEVPIENIRSGKIPGTFFSEAIVAYFDVLGFSEKKDDEDIELCLLDFLAPLAVAAERYPNVRFNVFSDCAFVAASIESASDLLSAVRFAFLQWSADGILVRGGLSSGTYTENSSSALTLAAPLKNFVGNIFSGSGVTGAVKLEAAGAGALLFTDEKCAVFYHKRYGEHIFSLDSHRIIGWHAGDNSSLFWFAGISFLRLLRLLSFTNGKTHPVAQKLLNNLKYSFASETLPHSWSLVLALLSSATLTPEVRTTVLDLLGIVESDNFDKFKEVIDILQSKPEMELLRILADADSSISGFQRMSDRVQDKGA
ncbi:MAG: hypothetical protein WAW37_14525 [Syntrophobacteraceae bacterium]